MAEQAIRDMESLSLYLEEWTGMDSIPTMERIYERSEGGAIICCVPECTVKRRDANALWRHVHFGSHGMTFIKPTPELVFAALNRARWPEDYHAVADALEAQHSGAYERGDDG